MMRRYDAACAAAPFAKRRVDSDKAGRGSSRGCALDHGQPHAVAFHFHPRHDEDFDKFALGFDEGTFGRLRIPWAAPLGDSRTSQRG
jgi:hypothetical protein